MASRWRTPLNFRLASRCILRSAEHTRGKNMNSRSYLLLVGGRKRRGATDDNYSHLRESTEAWGRASDSLQARRHPSVGASMRMPRQYLAAPAILLATIFFMQA